MFKKILIGVGVVILVFVIVVATRPADFRVSRSASIAAPQPAVFAQVNDFRRWEAWNPWGKIDPTMKQTYEGAPAGKGAIYNWVGNKQVGEGRMTITESRPHDLILINLEFFKPMPGVCLTEFTFKPEGNEATAVTWTMTGKHNFIAKGMALFMDMDKMIGDQFEKGLAAMKSTVESAPKL